jgi:hypothetical protein
MAMARRTRAAAAAPVALAVLASLLLAPGAPARAADEVGLFFDDKGEQPCAELTQAYVALNVYLLLLKPSLGGGVAGWECTLGLSSNLLLMSTTLAGSGLNVDTPPYFQVGIGGLPLPQADVVQLAQLSVFVTATGPSPLFIYPYRIPSLPDTPAYAGPNGEPLVAMTPRSLAGGAVVGGVNLPECVREGATWSRIKRVYED